MSIIIAKNNTALAIFIEDLGLEIPGSGWRNLTSTFEVIDIINSDDLDAQVLNSNITINDGTIDLSPSDGFDHINMKTVYEDDTFTSITNDCKRYAFFVGK